MGRTVNAPIRRGMAFVEAMNEAHNGRNSGISPVKILAVFIGVEGIAGTAAGIISPLGRATAEKADWHVEGSISMTLGRAESEYNKTLLWWHCGLLRQSFAGPGPLIRKSAELEENGASAIDALLAAPGVRSILLRQRP